MKIAILYSHLKELGGVENVILKQSELLRERGHNVKCYFAYVDKRSPKNLINPRGYIKSYFNSLIPHNEAIRIILSIPLAPLALPLFSDAEVLLCHGYGSAPWIGYNLKKMKGTGYISYVHFPPRFIYLEPEMRKLWRFNSTRSLIYGFSKVAKPLLKKLDYVSILSSDKVLVNSQFTAQRVKAIYGVQPLVCYPPVNTSVFKLLDSETVKKARSRFGWPLILSTGRIVPIKRWEWLIKMMPHITRVFPSATLAITGEVSRENIRYVQKLIQLADDLGIKGNVKFLGFRSLSELAELYNAADVYAYPVPNEDFGLGPVEAMACGAPAVVWDDGAGPCETVVHGKMGFRAKPYDLKDFSEKILDAISMGKEDMCEATVGFVRENFSCERHLDVLEDALNQN